ncbi:MAG: RNA polymerase sigma factor [Granulosicoccus sp.]|nr:RNA polymerase sigma factor [Granulosicoccus sp.]
MSSDEFELLRLVATGDREAFESLFRLYHPRVYKFSMKLLQDHSLAEEATCDTLFAVWEGASKFKSNSSVSTWIFGIAYRRSMKSYKRDARHVHKIEPDVELEALTEKSHAVNPEIYANNILEGTQLLAAMETLSADHTVVVELTALGHSCAEIAQIAGCPENTVKTRMFHARRKLRAQLQETSHDK